MFGKKKRQPRNILFHFEPRNKTINLFADILSILKAHLSSLQITKKSGKRARPFWPFED